MKLLLGIVLIFSIVTFTKYSIQRSTLIKTDVCIPGIEELINFNETKDDLYFRFYKLIDNDDDGLYSDDLILRSIFQDSSIKFSTHFHFIHGKIASIYTLYMPNNSIESKNGILRSLVLKCPDLFAISDSILPVQLLVSNDSIKIKLFEVRYSLNESGVGYLIEPNF